MPAFSQISSTDTRLKPCFQNNPSLQSESYFFGQLIYFPYINITNNVQIYDNTIKKYK